MPSKFHDPTIHNPRRNIEEIRESLSLQNPQNISSKSANRVQNPVIREPTPATPAKAAGTDRHQTDSPWARVQLAKISGSERLTDDREKLSKLGKVAWRSGKRN